MKIKQILFCASLICATCACSAEDSYLLWFVNPEATFGEGLLANSDAFKGQTLRAKVSYFESGSPTEWVYGGGEYLVIHADNDGIPASTGDNVISFDSSLSSQYFASIPTGQNVQDWTYYVELYNESGIFAHSEALSNLTEEGIATLAGIGKPGTLWNVKAFVPAAVPEPNSALLLLLGIAGLALRRRKQVVA